MRVRVVLVVLAAIGAGMAVIALVVGGDGHRAQAAQPGPAAGMMQTITPYQLSSVGVQLGETTTTPTVTAAAADLVGQRLFGSSVLETVLAQCTRVDIAPQVSEPCYAISIQPPTGPQYDLAGPDAAYDNSHPSAPPTFELALVSASNGQLIAGFSTGTAPNPPTKD